MKRSLHVETIHRGRLFSVEELSWKVDGGTDIRREVVRHPGAVLVIPVLNHSKIVMVRNYRVAVDERLYELPAGTLDKAEIPASAAARELEEETGYVADSITKIGEFFTSPGFADERMHVFLAQGLKFVGQKLEPHEEIEVEIIELDDALAMIDDGRIRDGKTIAGLLMWHAQATGKPR